MLKCKQEKLDALVREMDDCDTYICVANIGDKCRGKSEGFSFQHYASYPTGDSFRNTASSGRR